MTSKSVLTLFIGGPKDGDFYDIDFGKSAHAMYAPANPEFVNYDETPYISAQRPKTVTYYPQKICCPDGWIEHVLVYENTNLDDFTESQLIRFIMSGWRARHAQ